MSENANLDAGQSSPPPQDRTVQVDYLEMRRRKREQLEEMSTPRGDGSLPTPEEVLDQWPADPVCDVDAASVLFEDFRRRREQGDQPSVSDYDERFPAQKNSLADLMRRQDFFHSTGVKSAASSGGVLRLPELGEELFGFKMRDLLGRGAFAQVYIAEQAGLADRPVVLKVSAIEGNEPQTLAQLQHTNIVPIYSVHEDAAAGIRAVCMPYFGGASLSAVLQKLRKAELPTTMAAQFLKALTETSYKPEAPARDAHQPEASARDDGRPSLTLRVGVANPVVYADWSYLRAAAWIIARLAEGLQHAHDRGVLHRDIKPSNILIDRDGQPLLLDFNLSQDLNNTQAKATIGGTVAYMAPEHLRALATRNAALAKQVDRRADLYSLGMVLFEMLAGESPFDQSASYAPLPALIEAMALERGRTVPSLRKKRPDVPWSLESILRKCLAPDPSQRYQRGEDLAEDLRHFLADQPLKFAPELSVRERAAKWLRRHPRVASAGSVGTVAAVLLLCTLGALAGVSNYLAEARDALEVEQAQDRRRDFDSLARNALRLGGTGQVARLDNAHEEQATLAPEAPAVIRAALDVYGAAERDDWQDQPAWRRLDPLSQRRVAEDVRELLMLLAWARTLQEKSSPDSLNEALKWLDRAAAVRDLSPTPALLIDRAGYLEALGRADEAKNARDEAARTPPVNARDHFLLALGYNRARRLAEAITELNSALALNPQHYWSSALRGLCYQDLGEHTLAVVDFSWCLGQAPEAWVYANRGFSLYALGRKTEAIRDYDSALRLDANMVEPRWNRGLAQLDLGNFKEALADFSAVKNAARLEAIRALNEGVALEGLGRAEEADAAFATALDGIGHAHPEVRRVVLMRYGVAVTRRLPERATSAFLDLLKVDSEDATALYGLGAALVLRGDSETALARFDQALDIRPDFIEARRFRAILLARKGKGNAALRDINICLGKEPGSGMTLYAAACVTALLGHDNDELLGRSLDFLKRAFAHGYGRDKAAEDDDLANLRPLKEFKDLIGN
jgi:serine/threonine protein kinase/Tfp pilus assembly protein PilF